jgi:ABC-type nitrate/sulfonate/bicarbonate transport system substrate-binding protein
MHDLRRARTLLSTLILAVATLGAGPAPAGMVAQDAAKPLQTIRIGLLPNDDMISVLYAQQTGMFKDAGLDVVLDKSSPNGSAIATAVAAGSYDIGKTSITPIFDAHLHGLPFTIIGTAALYDSSKPYVGFIVPVDSPIKSAKQLTGPNAVSFIHDLGQLAIYKEIDEAGGDYKASTFIELPMSASAAAVESNRVTAAEISYPPAQAAIETGKVRMVPAYNAFGKQFIFSVWFTTQDYAKKHADVVKTFARVIAASARYTNAHPKETAPMLAAFTGVPEAVIDRMPRVTNGTSVYVSGIQPLIDTEAKYGFISRSFPAAEIIDPDVLGK